MKNPTFSRFICYNSVFSSALNNFIFAFFACIFFIYTRFEDTHQAIIDLETWEIVQKAREQRRRPTKMGEMGMFSGLAYCADCGAKLYHCRTTSWTHEQECYTCATYRGKKGCSAHYIRAVVLEQLVLQNLQRVVTYAQEDEDEFVRRIMENKMALQRTEQ